MAMSDWFMLIHPTIAIAIGFPLLGIVPLLFGHNGCKVDDLFIDDRAGYLPRSHRSLTEGSYYSE